MNWHIHGGRERLRNVTTITQRGRAWAKASTQALTPELMLLITMLCCLVYTLFWKKKQKNKKVVEFKRRMDGYFFKYPCFLKNNSFVKTYLLTSKRPKQSNWKMGRGPEWTFLQRHANGQQTCEEMPNISNHQGMQINMTCLLYTSPSPRDLH